MPSSENTYGFTQCELEEEKQLEKWSLTSSKWSSAKQLAGAEEHSGERRIGKVT